MDSIGIDRRKIDRGVFPIEDKGSTEIDVPMDRDRRSLGFPTVQISGIESSKVVVQNTSHRPQAASTMQFLESTWGLALAGCGNSDGLSEQSVEIVATGLFGGE